MCGFAGILKRNNFTDNDRVMLERMSQAVRHRGPDENRIVTYDKLGFAFRRLSIIDLELGSQPFEYLDGRYVSVFNGEIYNYRDLREELIAEGCTFNTNSEIEVILTLYSRIGAEFIRKLRGMFALAIYDTHTGELFCGRDPFGIKPLYYRMNDEGIVFGSEMKLFLFDDSLPAFGVDTSMLQHYMSYQYVPEPMTITGEVKILEAGHYFICNAGGGAITTIAYADNRFAPDNTPYDAKKTAIRRAIESSVEYHMISDVPVGSFLSSGIDSAIITAVASRLSPGIKAFTVAFSEREYSEIDDAAKIASHLDVEHITYNGTFEDFIGAYEDVVYHLDSPVADPSTVAIYIICREAARHMKVVLSGEGSDEFFGGYRIYRDGLKTRRISELPGSMRSALRGIASVLPDAVKGKGFLERAATPLDKRYIGNAFIFTEAEKAKFLKHYNPNQHFYDLTRGIYAKSEGLSLPTRMQYCDINTWLRGDILVKGDRLSMAHALEVRVPFIDREVFEIARTLNDSDKLGGGSTKEILRDAFKDLVDAETYVRPKLGYPVPVRKWLKNEMYDWAAGIIRESGADEYIDKAYAVKLLDDHRAGRADNYRTLWVLLVFMTWHKLYVEQAGKTRQRILAGEM